MERPTRPGAGSRGLPRSAARARSRRGARHAAARGGGGDARRGRATPARGRSERSADDVPGTARARAGGGGPARGVHFDRDLRASRRSRLSRPAARDPDRRDRERPVPAGRPDQAVAEAETPLAIDETRPDILEMAGQLRSVLAERPGDLRGWRLAVQTEAGLGNLPAAWRAQDRVIAILGNEATAQDFSISRRIDDRLGRRLRLARGGTGDRGSAATGIRRMAQRATSRD